jgi:hypothetical protein
MIISASICGKKLTLKDPAIPNIFPVESVSLITGEYYAGKTSFLLDIAAGLLKKAPVHSNVEFAFSDGFDHGAWKLHYSTSCRHSELPTSLGFTPEKVFTLAEMSDSLSSYSELLGRFGIDLSQSKGQLNTSQKIILNTFASLENSFKNLDGKTNVLVLLDSVDAGLHPSYQAQFINYLTGFLAECKNKNGAGTVQVVIVSDSPLVVGDFPAASTCILTDGYWVAGADASGKDIGGLGAAAQEIYNLVLCTSTIPQFAINTINKTIANLMAGKCSELDDYVISVTGDSIIKRELVRMKDEIR